MNDSDYDVMQKKKIARCAASKKNGRKSKKVTFSSDYLTESERKKLNGKVRTYQMKEPISWKDFRSYPEEIQRSYLEYFSEAFNCTPEMFSKMVGTKNVNVSEYCRKHTYLKGVLCRRSSKEDKERFYEWLDLFYEYGPKAAEEFRLYNNRPVPSHNESTSDPEGLIAEEDTSGDECKMEDPLEECPPSMVTDKNESVFDPCKNHRNPLTSGVLKMRGTPAEIGQTLFGILDGESVYVEIKFSFDEPI